MKITKASMGDTVGSRNSMFFSIYATMWSLFLSIFAAIWSLACSYHFHFTYLQGSLSENRFLLQALTGDRVKICLVSCKIYLTINFQGDQLKLLIKVPNMPVGVELLIYETTL